MAVKGRTRKYLDLNGKYLKDAEALLAKGDYVQASEKIWGATAQIIKAVAAKRGIALRAHTSIAEFVSKLDDDKPELNLAGDFASAESLHVNFYEDWLPTKMVEKRYDVVKRFIKNVQQFL